MEVQEEFPMGRAPTLDAQKTFRWGEEMFEASYEVIHPYVQAYNLDAPKPAVSFRYDPIYLNGFMAASRDDDNGINFLSISNSRLKSILDLSRTDWDNRIYGRAYFFGAIAHELVHFSQYHHNSFDWIREQEDRAWTEGTAYLLGWLILSDIYRDSRNEPRSFYNSPDIAARAMRAKRMRMGLARAMAFHNYCFYIASLRQGFSYEPPGFLPPQAKALYQETVASGGPTFPTCGMECWVEEIQKNVPAGIVAVWAEWARGAMAGSRLLREKGFSPNALVANFISNDDIDKIIAGKA